MQDVWALHPAMPNASNYFLEQLTQVQKLSLDGLFIWDHPVEAEAWWRVRFGWVPYHLCQMACAVSSRPRGAPVRLVENEAGDKHALVTHLKMMWRCLQGRRKCLVPYWTDSLWTRLLWAATELRKEAVPATWPHTDRNGWGGEKRYRPRAASGPRPQTFARTPGPGLPVWKTGMATMVPPSEDGCHKEKLTNAKPLEMSMAQ